MIGRSVSLPVLAVVGPVAPVVELIAPLVSCRPATVPEGVATGAAPAGGREVDLVGWVVDTVVGEVDVGADGDVEGGAVADGEVGVEVVAVMAGGPGSKLLLAAICVLSQWTLEQIVQNYSLSKPQAVACLLAIRDNVAPPTINLDNPSVG